VPDDAVAAVVADAVDRLATDVDGRTRRRVDASGDVHATYRAMLDALAGSGPADP
jgi:hypothetical protein